MVPKIMFDDSPNDKPNGSMLFGQQIMFEAYQLSPPEVCWLINMLNVTHTHTKCLQLLFFIVIAYNFLKCLYMNQDLSLAMSLIRPARSYGDEELLLEKTRVTKDNYGTVAKVFIVCQQDKVSTHDFQLSMIERNPANDVKVIADADHMPMFSKPKELCVYLQEVADTYY